MTDQLDESLILRVKRIPKRTDLTVSERIAINLFWRKGVRAVILAKAFGIGKNTIYYQCLTGEAESYSPYRRGINAALEVNRVIDQIGFDAAWKKYVTPELIKKINAANEAEAKRRGT